MISSERKQKKQFRVANTNFSLEACKWKTIELKQKNREESSKNTAIACRIGQTCKVLSDHIYMFGGIRKDLEKYKFCAVNLKNHKWHSIQSQIQLPNISNHGLVILKNELYVFGGSNQDQYFNEMYSFNNFTNQWKNIESLGHLPFARDPMIFENYNNEKIILIGGVNMLENRYFQDAFSWKDNKWEQLKTINYPDGLIQAQTCSMGNFIYMFGGINRKTGQYNSELLKIQITPNNELEFKQIKLNTSPCPQGRIGHSMIAINHQYMLIVGGQKTNKKVFKDIWVFDVYTLNWFRIQPKNGPLKGIYSLSAVLYNNIIYLIGGYSENELKINEKVITIQFANEDIFRAEICNNCLSALDKKELQNKRYPKNLIISTGFLYNVALEIKFPFHAVSMIYEASKYFHASYFRFGIMKTRNNFDYIRIQFDGCSLGFKEFQQLLNHKNINSQFKIVMQRMKLGALRLGKTVLFTTTEKKRRYVYLISAESKVAPHFDQIYIYYTYVQNLQLQRIQTQEGIKQHSYIVNILKSYLPNPQVILNAPQKSILLIFDTKVMMTAQKEYYYELLENDDDIQIWKSEKKIKFLEERGYNISGDLEVSLRNFMTFYHFNPSPNNPQIYLNDSNDPIDQIKYKLLLKHFESKNLLIKAQLPEVEGVTIEGELYITNDQKVINSNFGVLIYCDGKLYSRYKYNFGSLFAEYFYKNKYKSAKTIFYQLGYLNVVGLEENFFKNDFKKSEKFTMFWQEIERVCQKARGHSQNEIDEEDSKTSKKVKV